MRLINGLHNLLAFSSEFKNGTAVTIGNFDGLHLGHQAVLTQLKQAASAKNLPKIAIVFEPLPIEFFRPTQAPVRLMNLREKARAFARQEIDFVLVLRFDQAFSELSAEDFIQQILLEGLNTKQLVVGDDFKFGHQRRGDFKLLQQQGEKHGFITQATKSFLLENQRVSSTRIREALAGSQNNSQPDLVGAKHLLGKDFSFEGRVIHGQKLARKLGFPTLNINPKRLQMPVNGVFAVEVAIAEQDACKFLPGVANIGIRPTVNGVQPSIEVHIFNWNQTIYGAHVEIKLCKFIRPEMKFNGLEELQSQIEKDAASAKEFFNLNIK